MKYSGQISSPHYLWRFPKRDLIKHTEVTNQGKFVGSQGALSTG